MKFRRNVHLYRGALDVTPLATLFFLLLIFLLLAGRIYTPGVHIQLPAAVGELPGTDKPPFSVALDAAGSLYFENQLIGRKELKARLIEAVKSSPEPLVLVVQADRATSQENIDALLSLASQAGIRDALLARLPSGLGETSPGGTRGKP